MYCGFFGGKIQNFVKKKAVSFWNQGNEKTGFHFSLNFLAGKFKT